MAHDECPMAKALKEDRPIRGEEAITERPDGTRVPFMSYPTPLHDASGRLERGTTVVLGGGDYSAATRSARISGGGVSFPLASTASRVSRTSASLACSTLWPNRFLT